MLSTEIEVGDLFQLDNGNIGRIITGQEKPIGFLTGVVCGETKARVPLPIPVKTIKQVKRNGGQWIVVEHFKMEEIFQ